MKNSNNEKKIFFTYQNSFFLFIVFGFLLLSIGYATINPIVMQISGISSAKKAEYTYISEVSVFSNVDAVLGASSLDYTRTFLQGNVTLSNTNKASEITYKVTVHNGNNYNIYFDGKSDEVIEGLTLNNNSDIIVEVTSADNLIEKNTSQDFYVTIKYRDVENMSEISSNTENVGINLKFKGITYITYVGFDDTSSYDTQIYEGDNLIIDFGPSISYITLVKNQRNLSSTKDFTFINNTLTYRATTGGNLEISCENNFVIRDNFDVSGIYPGNSFVVTGNDPYNYNADEDTIFWEFDVSELTTLNSKDNILSIGTDIDNFRPENTDGINFHVYYPNSDGDFILSLAMKNITGQLQFNASANQATTKIAKFAFNSNGLYYNGNMLLSPSEYNTSLAEPFGNYSGLQVNEYLQTFFTTFSNDLQIKIGSREGANRSYATYNDIIVFDSKLTGEELANLTSITEHIRTDYNVTLLPTDSIVKNQPFTLYSNQVFDIETQTLIVEMDASSSLYEFENILSLGKEIAGWIPNASGASHLHFFYSPGATQHLMTAAPLVNGLYMKQYEKVFDLIDDKYIKIGFGINGVYLNGYKLFDNRSLGAGVTYKNGATPGNETSYLESFFGTWLADNYTIDIGSTQGTSRSNAEYISFEICNIAMTTSELVYHTGRHEE